ncbi:MAG: M48 family metallopeptidase [Chloroflexota bacterium]
MGELGLDDRPEPAGADGSRSEDGERLDLSAVEPERWRSGIPWWPGLGVIITLVALPGLSLALSSGVAARQVGAPAVPTLLETWRGLAMAALVSGGAAFAVVPVAALVVRGRTRAILALLRFGVPVGVVLIAIVVMLHALLAGASVVAVMWLILGWAHAGAGGIVAFLGLAAATYLLGAGLTKLRHVPAHEPAISLGRSDAPQLVELVNDLAKRVGVERPDAILLGPAGDFWVGRGTVRALNDSVDGVVLHASIPTLALLSRAQIEAVIAHELGHIRNGDTDVGWRLAPAFERLRTSIDVLEKEAEGIGAVAAWPGMRWLDYAKSAVGVVVGETRRDSEARADAVAADVVGAEVTAETLLAVHAVAVVEDLWLAALDEAFATAPDDPIESFTTAARASLVGATPADIIEHDLFGLRADHPALLTRLRALGQVGAALEVSDAAALTDLVADPRAQLMRIIEAIKDVDPRGHELLLNAPRLTPGVVAWAITGLVFGAIFGWKGLQDGLGGDEPIIAAIVAAVWLSFPIVYLHLQHEVAVDRHGIHVRSWWRHWLDRGGRPRWVDLRWTSSMSLTTRFEEWVTVSNGFDTASWWAAIWPRRELAALVDGLRERRGVINFASEYGVQDVERLAVLWCVRGRIVVPEVQLGADGSILEMRPVKAPGRGPLRLSFALSDRLVLPVKPAGGKDRIAHPAHLAEVAKIDLETFEREARRIVVRGSREVWEVAVDDVLVWSGPRRTDLYDVAEVILAIAASEARSGAAATGEGQPAAPAPEDIP